MTAPGDPDPTPEVPEDLSGRVAGSAANLMIRRFAVMGLGAVGAAVVTRILGPSDYGQYAAAIATWTLLSTSADFGFSMMLSRDLPHTPESSVRALVRAACRACGGLALGLAVVMGILAVVAGLDTDRGQCLAVMIPAIVSAGLAPSGTLFLVRYRTRPMAFIDVSATVVTVGGQIVAAALDTGPVGVAVASSGGSILNIVVNFVYAQRHLAGPPSALRVPLRTVVRDAVPLGILAVMTKVYLLGDLVLLGWLVSGDSLGQYAAAARMLTLLTTIAALVIGAALPAFSAKAAEPEELARLATKVWHWLMCSALVVFSGVAVFTGPAITVLVGPAYDDAEHLLRILCLAGFVGILSNLLGSIMVATRQTKTLFIQNAVAIVLNVSGNLILVPEYGVEASAWLTVATEVLICVAAFAVLAPRLDLRGMGAVSYRPLAACAAGAATGFAIGSDSAVGIVAAGGVMLLTLSALRGWPSEFAGRFPLLRAQEAR